MEMSMRLLLRQLEAVEERHKLGREIVQLYIHPAYPDF
jgi:hypothetical protein